MPENEQCFIEIHAHEGKWLPKQYVNLVRSRWMRSYRRCNDYMRLVDADSYYHAYSNYITVVLGRPRTIVRLAVLSDDNDVALGFSVCELKVLHYVDVPKVYRKKGIGRSLVPEQIEWFTHLTRIGARLWSTKAPHAKFSPFI